MSTEQPPTEAISSERLQSLIATCELFIAMFDRDSEYARAMGSSAGQAQRDTLAALRELQRLRSPGGARGDLMDDADKEFHRRLAAEAARLRAAGEPSGEVVTDAIRDCIGIAGMNLQAEANAELSALLRLVRSAPEPAAKPCPHERCVMWCPDCGIPPPADIQWQRIETAPKHRPYSDYLLVAGSKRNGDGWVGMGTYDTIAERWYAMDGESMDAPTHWQPIPSPPTKDDQP